MNAKFSNVFFSSVAICVFLWLLSATLNAQTLAPGAPGKDAQWASAGKQGVGTSASSTSRVWFTLQGGALTEVYYPDVTIANVHILQFVVVDPRTKRVETERDDSNHQIRVTRPDSLSFQQINTARSGKWKITKTYTTDIERDSVLIDVSFETKNKNLKLYVYYDPSLGNSGMGDKAYSPLLQLKGEYEYEKKTITARGTKSIKRSGEATVSGGMASEDGKYVSTVFFSSDIEEYTNGYKGVNDGLAQLRKFGRITETYAEATKGNVVQMARIMKPQRFTTILSFSDTGDVLKTSTIASKSYQKGFVKCLAEYEKEWSDYVKTLPKVEAKFQAQFNMAAMILKAHEDKANPGANIASLTVPWGGGDNANENNVGGYHLVWSRDLYQVATAFMALGDKAAAERALDFLFKVQQKPDGSFPQNSWLDGRPFWGSLQMDEVAYPLILAHELGKHDKITYEDHVTKAAEFIVKNGPATPQERWEEEGGYSPSTIAAEIAGLVCAAEIAKKNGDVDSAKRWLETADNWAANIEKWTVTTNGPYSKEPYYIRITQNGKPDAGEKIELNNGVGFFDEREIVDAGFLELVRLGIKPADDPIIKNSLKVIDKIIKVETPNGDGFYRYNNDGYGEMDDGRRWNWDGKYTGKGRLWALLSGERGQYEIARAAFLKEKFEAKGQANLPRKLSLEELGIMAAGRDAVKRLDAMLAFANDGLMIPEQVWDKAEVPKADSQFSPNLKFGEGTGSATPLAWSMAQFIRLAVNIKAGRNLDTPQVVYDRYVGIKNKALATSISAPAFTGLPSYRKDTELLKTAYSLKPIVFTYSGKEKAEIVGDFTGWQSKGLLFKDGKITLEFPSNTRVEYKLIVDGKWITDPANSKKVDNGVGGENSVLEMPDYRPTVWAENRAWKLVKNAPSLESATFPRLEEVDIESSIYGKRRIKVFLPQGYGGKRTNPKEYPVLYLQDGTDYFTRAGAVFQMENLAEDGKIKPFILVFLDANDRMKEYWANDGYAKFLAKEVVPFIDSKYKTIRSREGRAVIGASLGGITSIWVALKYPNVFSRVGAQSASFWIDDERVVKELEKLDGKTPFSFYIDDGKLEGVEDTRKVCAILRMRSYKPRCLEGEAGHNWTAWKDRLADALIFLMK